MPWYESCFSYHDEAFDVGAGVDVRGDPFESKVNGEWKARVAVTVDAAAMLRDAERDCLAMERSAVDMFVWRTS